MWTPRWWRLRKARKQQEIIAQGLLQLHYLAISAHGRHQLRWVIENTEEDEVPDIIKGMYSWFLSHAPVADYAVFN